MRFYLALLGCLCLLSLPDDSSAILLCDGDCMNISTLEICQDVPENKTLLNVMALFPCNVPGFRARGLTVAAQMAVQQVTKNSNLLQGYSLKLQVDNTMCAPLPAIRAFIDQLSQVQQGVEGQRYMIIGPGCSVGATTTAEVAPFYSLTQIGYTTTSVSLSDEQRFPNFLRAISSDNASITTVTSLVRKFEWRQVAIVSAIDDLFSNLTAVQRAALRQAGVVVQEFIYTNSNAVDVIERLNTSGARIVLLNILEDGGREIFCEAYMRGMLYPMYTFISHYWWSEFWWTDGVGSTNCTVLQLTNAIRMSLAVDHFPSPSEEGKTQMTDVGYSSPSAFWDDFRRNLRVLNYFQSEALRQAAFVYDAVWMAAFALDNTSRALQRGEVPGASGLESFNHFENPSLAADINNLILNATKDSLFRGVSGRVKLNQFGDREPSRRVFQYLYTEVVNPDVDINNDTPFAIVDNNEALQFLGNHSIQTVFPDGVTVDVELVGISVALFGVYTFLACLGIIFAVVCMVFNLVFKKKRIVKLTSPYLNLLIITGAILFYMVAITFGLDTSFAGVTAVDIVRCQMSVWLASIGFSLLFGTMLVKTWRVYYIFKNIKLKKRPLKDWKLFLVVMLMVAVDVVFLIVVSVDIFRIRLQPQPLMPRMDGQVPTLMYSCDSAPSSIWLAILLSYKALYLLVGVFLAVQTYNVKLKRLRDSKLIVACVCSICVAALVGTVVALTITEPTVSYAIYGFFILSVVTAILFILFGTLMIELWKNPSGETDVTTVASVGNNYLDNPTKASSEDQAKIDQLRQTIQSLKRDIAAKKQASLSPVHGDELVASKTNLLLDHVTPKHNHVTESPIDTFPDKDHETSNQGTSDNKTAPVSGEPAQVHGDKNALEISPVTVEVGTTIKVNMSRSTSENVEPQSNGKYYDQ